MTEYVCFCGQECSSARHLGQHVAQTQDQAHNYVEAEAGNADNGEKPNNLLEEWREESDKDVERTINEVEIPDEPADAPEYVEISELESEDYTDQEIRQLQAAMDQGYTKIEDADKPLEERELKK